MSVVYGSVAQSPLRGRCSKLHYLSVGLMAVGVLALPLSMQSYLAGDGIVRTAFAQTVPTVFQYNRGAVQTYTVPAGATAIQVGAWGAGGADGTGSTSGGGGGFTGATLLVTPGDVIDIIVGEGGVTNDTTPQFGGGGAGGNDASADSYFGASGGGRSAVIIGGTEVLTAGGGGGGGSSVEAGASSPAGAGGDMTGQDATHDTNPLFPGLGGSQTAGGLGGGIGAEKGVDGSQFMGGTGGESIDINRGGGGGGGGGYYGGGGGSAQDISSQDGAGGGGSSYVDATIGSSIVMMQGNLTATANTSDANYVAGIGEGGDGIGAANKAGSDGLVYVIPTIAPPVVTPPVTPPVVDVVTSVPVYRFWSHEYQSHFYTMNETEKDSVIKSYDENTWLYEGVAFQAYEDAGTDTVPVYRFWSDEHDAHFYTSSEVEKDAVMGSDAWTSEGVAWHAEISKQPTHRFYSSEYTSHFYTNSQDESDSLQRSEIWDYEGTVHMSAS